MSERVFVDTSAWYALTDRHDANHDAATRILRRSVHEGVVLVTTNHVAGETYTLMRNRLGSRHAWGFLDRVRTSPSTQRVFVQEGWEDAAEDLFGDFGDQPFSFVDATSFVAMRRLRIQKAFAFDRHFSTAGFTLMTTSDGAS